MLPQGAPGPLKWRPGAPKTIFPGTKMSPRRSELRAKSAKMGPQSVPMAAQMGNGSPTCSSKCSQERIWVPMGASGTDFGGLRAPILEDLASILSKRFYPFNCISCTPFQSIPFHFIPFPFHTIPFHSVACRSIPIHSIPFHCNFTPRRSNVPGFRNSRVGYFWDIDVPVIAHEPPIGLGGMREA